MQEGIRMKIDAKDFRAESSVISIWSTL